MPTLASLPALQPAPSAQLHSGPECSHEMLSQLTGDRFGSPVGWMPESAA